MVHGQKKISESKRVQVPKCLSIYLVHRLIRDPGE